MGNTCNSEKKYDETPQVTSDDVVRDMNNFMKENKTAEVLISDNKYYKSKKPHEASCLKEPKTDISQVIKNTEISNLLKEILLQGVHNPISKMLNTSIYDVITEFSVEIKENSKLNNDIILSNYRIIRDHIFSDIFDIDYLIPEEFLEDLIAENADEDSSQSDSTFRIAFDELESSKEIEFDKLQLTSKAEGAEMKKKLSGQALLKYNNPNNPTSNAGRTPGLKTSKTNNLVVKAQDKKERMKGARADLMRDVGTSKKSLISISKHQNAQSIVLSETKKKEGSRQKKMNMQTRGNPQEKERDSKKKKEEIIKVKPTKGFLLLSDKNKKKNNHKSNKSIPFQESQLIEQDLDEVLLEKLIILKMDDDKNAESSINQGPTNRRGFKLQPISQKSNKFQRFLTSSTAKRSSVNNVSKNHISGFPNDDSINRLVYPRRLRRKGSKDYEDSLQNIITHKIVVDIRKFDSKTKHTTFSSSDELKNKKPHHVAGEAYDLTQVFSK